MGAGELTSEIGALLGPRARSLTLEPCTAGGNNRVFLVRNGDERLIAKSYYSHASDTRDRLRAEYAFLSYAMALGLDCVPRPVSCDRAAHLGLYEFVDGRKLGPDEITRDEIDAALRFFLALNDPDRRALATDLPVASEACFSLGEHFAMVEQRLARLDGMEAATEVDRAAQTLAQSMRTRWLELKPAVERGCSAAGFAASAVLPERDRCISPSDFGFHNALARADGRLAFIDFEYAGWDDPAKFANDFFCQPAVPVDPRHYDAFVREAMGFSSDPERMAARTRAMRPIFQMKWCCIILNDFLPAAARRRRFADPSLDLGERKARQLERARTRLLAIGT